MKFMSAYPPPTLVRHIVHVYIDDCCFLQERLSDIDGLWRSYQQALDEPRRYLTEEVNAWLEEQQELPVQDLNTTQIHHNIAKVGQNYVHHNIAKIDLTMYITI